MPRSSTPRPPRTLDIKCDRGHRHTDREQIAACDRRLALREQAKRAAVTKSKREGRA